MGNAFFVTGTDTDCGKTLVAASLLAAARRQGFSTAGIKPVAAGCEQTPQGLRNSDAELLRAHTSLELSYEQINPVALEPAIAPHIAAKAAGRRLNADRLVGFCRGVLMQRPDVAVIEGAGGWRVPLNDRETLADIARQLQLPVILVVGMKLGCINHALLTAEAIMRDGLTLAGWVPNTLGEKMPGYEQNLATLQRRLPAPMIGELPFLTEPTPECGAEYLDMAAIL